MKTTAKALILILGAFCYSGVRVSSVTEWKQRNVCGWHVSQGWN